VVSSVLYISRYSWVQTQTILLYSTVSMVSKWIDLSFVYWKLVMNFGWCFYLGCFLTVWIRLVLEKPVARNFRPIMSSAYFVIFHGVTSLHMVNILVWVRRLTIILSSIFSVRTHSVLIITNLTTRVNVKRVRVVLPIDFGLYSRTSRHRSCIILYIRRSRSFLSLNPRTWLLNPL
jgi:hypothetical protein